MSDSIARLTATVQTNCHIADARHGADYGMCVYLMRMREYFRWERGHRYDDPLDKDEIGDWLDEREALWDGLVEDDFHPLEIQGRSFDPFDEASINTRLREFGLVYGGGLAIAGRPQFFLARLEDYERVGGADVYVAGQELARGLTAFPAMSRGGVILLRRESLERMIWEKLTTWRWSRPDNALGRAFTSDDFDNDLDAALHRMTERQTRLVLLHEIGEHHAGELLGPRWEELLLSFGRGKTELMLRAVRDFIADCHGPLPALAEGADAASVHFLIGGLSPMCRQLFPALLAGYERWREDGDALVFTRLADAGLCHWRAVAEDALEIHAQCPAQAEAMIQEMITRRALTRVDDLVADESC